MRILAIETIDKAGSVAALEGDRLLVEHSLGDRQRSLQTLAPAMRQVLDELGWRPQDVGLVAVATGPGSFTGLRIGVATAKAFAYASESQVLGVGTMSVLAAQVPGEHKHFTVAVDAQREELFITDFHCDSSGSPVQQGEPRIVGATAWLATLRPDDLVTGPGLRKWLQRLPADVMVVDETNWQPRASTVGRLAFHAFERGQRGELLALAPQYFRETAAEEQWRRKQKS